MSPPQRSLPGNSVLPIHKNFDFDAKIWKSVQKRGEELSDCAVTSFHIVVSGMGTKSGVKNSLTASSLPSEMSTELAAWIFAACDRFMRRLLAVVERSPTRPNQELIIPALCASRAVLARFRRSKNCGQQF